jgi:hypothetical protein
MKQGADDIASYCPCKYKQQKQMCIRVHSPILTLFSLLETVQFVSGKFVAQNLVLNIWKALEFRR